MSPKKTHSPSDCYSSCVLSGAEPKKQKTWATRQQMQLVTGEVWSHWPWILPEMSGQLASFVASGQLSASLYHVFKCL